MNKHHYGFMVFIFILMLGVNAYAAEERFAEISKLDGTAQIRLQKGEWQPATLGAILHEGDEIRTDKGSYVELLLDDQGSTGRLEIKELSRMRLNTLKRGQSDLEKKTLLDLAVGKVMVHVEKLQGDSAFEVNTPTASAGVRGTVFEVAVEGKNRGTTKPQTVQSKASE